MPRPGSSVLWLATLASGMAIGLGVGRIGPRLSAQIAPPRGEFRDVSGTEEDAYRELARGYDRFQAVDRTFEMVAKVVSPAVVHITARKEGPREDGELARYEETGSGVIVRPDGGAASFVLTNNHVVEGALAPDIAIRLHDGQTLWPEAVWCDPKADIAVMKVPRDRLPAARLGNSDDARVGSWVLALGSPFGLTHSVSQGIISARGRFEPDLEMEGVEHQEFLQTDAAINPGNSGGPLVNMKGEVVGINTAIASNGGGSEGVGFSIPINLARWAMTQLIAGGKVSRGAIGVNLQTLSPAKAAELGLDRPRGARIVAVHETSPAAKANLVVGDVILRFGGVEVLDENHLINLVAMAPIGQSADLVVWHDRKAITARVTVADRDAILARSAPESSSRRPEGSGRSTPGSHPR